MAKDATKVVVRLLPPLITEDELLSTISEESQKNAASRVFIPGKRHKGEKASRNAVCYFNFSSEEQSELFIKEYHGHQFVDDQGEQFRAVACYAPYQKFPKKKETKDTREGTIEDDAAYKEFVENLSKPKDAFVAPEDPKLSLKPTEPGNTPLLQHMKNKAKERRARLEKRKKQRWDSLEYIPEDETGSSKKAKWHCSECGTSKNLEEDPDDRGSFYCSRCWESWESSYASSSKSKKKKKKHSYYEDDYDHEEPAAETTSKKSKKKRQKEAAADDWYATTSKDDGSESKHRRKKKDKYDKYEEWWEEDSGSSWRAKKKDSYAEEYPKSKKDKKHRDQWAEVDEEKPSRHKKGSKHDKGDGVVVSRWKAKKSGEEEWTEKEEKPRHSRRKDRDSDSGAQWVPKNR